MDIIKFSDVNLSQDLKVMKDVSFVENSWRIQISQSEHVNFQFTLGKVVYDRDCIDILNLVKMLSYYEFPKLVKLNITSWYTSASRNSMYINAARNFLFENGFISSVMLSNITIKQCSNYIENCIQDVKNDVKGSRYKLLSAIRFFDAWTEATERELLPSDFQFAHDSKEIINDDLRTEIYILNEDKRNPWMPLDASVIEQVYSEAEKYINRYAPTIIKCSKLLNTRQRRGEKEEAGLDNIREDGRTKHLFLEFKNMEIPEISDGVKLFNFEPKKQKVASLGYACGWQWRTSIDIGEVRPAVIKLKRLCIFIIGLFTGLRRREIAALPAKKTFTKNDSEYLNIIRYKTSNDSEVGQSDTIPVPQIVSSAVDVLIDLFQENREALDTNKLLVTDILTKKKFKRIKLNTINKDIKEIVKEVTGVEGAHTHQLRKSIAWLLISRSEKNIDLIRQLFGHKSYGMTIRYIMRNELMVDSVIELLEHNYTEDLKEVFDAIRDNKTSGALSKKIKERMEDQKYSGQILLTDIETYVKESLRSGLPLFVSRVPIGGFCMKSGDDNVAPPCMNGDVKGLPNINNCNYKECEHLIFNEESVRNIHSQIKYYKKKIIYLEDSSNESVVSYYENEIIEHTDLLKRLKDNSSEINKDIQEEVI
ncbi:tyrosine-type recombinase/integrase [Vibrio sp. Makdt]|uniref:tyrosine-type recombinase/integrase n=1 Tax=Vibrio sp. Makdt TaxID=2998828 RepID=UPI0022CD9F09|nr:tyrosine-type recombinase/integrase [Vibrio sp. Makdt]MDA0151587.1 tyrosine-type recombinase/integrase [Vibrio sp. Makdt]